MQLRYLSITRGRIGRNWLVPLEVQCRKTSVNRALAGFNALLRVLQRWLNCYRRRIFIQFGKIFAHFCDQLVKVQSNGAVLAYELKSLPANLKIELVQTDLRGSFSWPLCGDATTGA